MEFLVQDEKARVLLTSMVSCLFAREVYKESVLAECLKSVGYGKLAEALDPVARRVQSLRWQLRLKSGFDPATVKIPGRFREIVTWKGPLDGNYLDALLNAYAGKIREMGKEGESGPS